MFLKLTNASKEFEGTTLLINPRHAMSIFPSKIKEQDEEKNVTIIYGLTQQSWSVKESADEIYALIKSL